MSTTNADVPYLAIVDCFKEGSVIPFLGSAASSAGAHPDEALPTGLGLAAHLARKGQYPGATNESLSKIAQFLVEVSVDRDYLLREISHIFHNKLSSTYGCTLTGFFLNMPSQLLPKLVLTTNYDTLMERILEERGERYLAIAHLMKGTEYHGRLLVYSSLREALTRKGNIVTVRALEDILLESSDSASPPVIIYKMHGTALMSETERLDSIILTEDDYTDFLARDLPKMVPAQLMQQLRQARFLFLGYSLSDWNFRVFLRRMQWTQRRDKTDEKRHWACLRSVDEVERLFWHRRGVNLYSESLENFLGNLERTMGESL